MDPGAWRRIGWVPLVGLAAARFLTAAVAFDTFDALVIGWLSVSATFGFSELAASELLLATDLANLIAGQRCTWGRSGRLPARWRPWGQRHSGRHWPGSGPTP